MSGERHIDEVFEEQLRELLVRDADIVRPAPAPYPAIRRRGMAERRRRVAAVGAALVALTVVPVGAYAWAGGSGDGGADTASPMTSVSTPHSPAASPKATAAGPARPASDAQLLDGITFAQAADGLQKCLDAEQVSSLTGMPGKASGYRIILAAKSTGDSNAPGDGFHVVAVRDEPTGSRVICNVKDGKADGINVSSRDAAAPDAGPVVPDPNGADLYMQSIIDKGKWKLPFRWAAIGYVDASVAKVTVTYGDSTADPAVLDHGWYIAYGTLNEQVTQAPRIMGYDAAGKLVYDSDTDKTYDRTLP